MRFTKRARIPFVRTERKDAALRRKQRLERESLPLFAEEIGQAQPSVDQVMSARERHWIEGEQRDRADRAAQWRAVRREINALPGHQRRLFLAFWNAHRWFPGDPSYCSMALHSYKQGRYVEFDGELVSSNELEYRQGLRRQVQEATDAELDGIIQRAINMVLVEFARAERNKRLDAKHP